MTEKPGAEDMAERIAMATTDKVARLRVLHRIDGSRLRPLQGQLNRCGTPPRRDSQQFSDPAAKDAIGTELHEIIDQTDDAIGGTAEGRATASRDRGQLATFEGINP